MLLVGGINWRNYCHLTTSICQIYITFFQHICNTFCKILTRNYYWQWSWVLVTTHNLRNKLWICVVNFFHSYFFSEFFIKNWLWSVITIVNHAFVSVVSLTYWECSHWDPEHCARIENFGIYHLLKEFHLEYNWWIFSYINLKKKSKLSNSPSYVPWTTYLWKSTQR